MNCKIDKIRQWTGIAFTMQGNGGVILQYRGQGGAWCSVGITRKEAANAIRSLRAKLAKVYAEREAAAQ